MSRFLTSSPAERKMVRSKYGALYGIHVATEEVWTRAADVAHLTVIMNRGAPTDFLNAVELATIANAANRAIGAATVVAPTVTTTSDKPTSTSSAPAADAEPDEPVMGNMFDDGDDW